MLQLDNWQVVQVKKDDTDGYTGVQIGAGEVKPKNVNKPDAGHYAASNVPAKRKLWEFRVSRDAILSPGE